MKQLNNLNQIQQVLDHALYTYDYTDGLFINSSLSIQVYDLNILESPGQDLSGLSGYLITFDNEETLYQCLKQNLDEHMDLSAGADDQYYDYSPSQVEAIIFGITQLSPDHREEIIDKLKKHLWDFIQDEEQDYDMVDIYDRFYKALEKYGEDHLILELIPHLYISELYQALK
nr:MAG: hypothetical protein [Bacteriophage sp.]